MLCLIMIKMINLHGGFGIGVSRVFSRNRQKKNLWVKLTPPPLVGVTIPFFDTFPIDIGPDGNCQKRGWFARGSQEWGKIS